MKKFEFDAVINKHKNLNAGYIDFPYNVKKEFNKNRLRLKQLLTDASTGITCKNGRRLSLACDYPGGAQGNR